MKRMPSYREVYFDTPIFPPILLSVLHVSRKKKLVPSSENGNIFQRRMEKVFFFFFKLKYISVLLHMSVFLVWFYLIVDSIIINIIAVNVSFAFTVKALFCITFMLKDLGR